MARSPSYRLCYSGLALSKEISLVGLPHYWSLLKEARKGWEYSVCDEIVHLLKIAEPTPNSLVGVAKDYVRGNIWIECHITFEVNGNNCHSRIILESAKGSELFRDRENKVSNDSIGQNSSVLVDVAQPIEFKQQMVFDGRYVAVPSKVWLEGFNEVPCFCGYAPRASKEFFFVGSAENRKLGSTGVAFAEFCETPNKLIERGSEAIQKVANHQDSGIGNIPKANINDVGSVFGVILTAKGARIRFIEGPKFLPQVLKVFVRPGCLEIGVSQAQHKYPSVGVELSA